MWKDKLSLSQFNHHLCSATAQIEMEIVGDPSNISHAFQKKLLAYNSGPEINITSIFINLDEFKGKWQGFHTFLSNK